VASFNCTEHKNIQEKIKLNILNREIQIQKKYSILCDDRIYFVTSNVKGSWAYANNIRKKLNSMLIPTGSKNLFMTLTFKNRTICVYCAYDHIMQNWRSLRQNWNNYELPQILGFVGVIEPHKDLFPHLHFSLFLKNYFSKLQMSSMHDIWGSRVDIQPARNVKGYLFKYLSKGLKDLSFISTLQVLKRRQYFSSRNVFQKAETKKRETLFLGEVDSDIHEFKYNEFKIAVAGEYDGWDYISGAGPYDLYGRTNHSLPVKMQNIY